MLSVLARARKSLGPRCRWRWPPLRWRPASPPRAADGPRSRRGQAVQVALLVPGGSGQASDELLAQSLENAARLAMADLSGVQIDLRVYPTAGSPADGQRRRSRPWPTAPQVILGPVYAQEANAAGAAVAASGVNVLSFSNNAAVAGGNVFVLGQTFQNTADASVALCRAAAA